MKSVKKDQPGLDPVSIPATRFNAAGAKSKKEITLTAKYLQDLPVAKSKKVSPWIKLALFGDEKTKKGSLRSDANVTDLLGVELDYDRAEHTMEEAVELLQAAGIQALVYPSASYTIEEPRWRVLLPFSEPFEGSEDEMRRHRNRGITYCEGIFGFKVARESRTLSQSYYMGPVVDNQGHYKVHETTGKCVDQLMGSNGIDREVDLDNLEDWEPDDERPAFDMEGAIASITSGEEVHPHLVAIAGHLWSTGMSETALRILLINLAKQSGRQRDFDAEVNKIVTYIKLKDPREEAPDNENQVGLKGWTCADDGGEEVSQEELVQGVLQINTASMMVAGYNVGKSAFAVDLVAAIASGQSTWCGLQIQHLPCFYMAAEAPGSIRNRVRSYFKDGYDLSQLHVISNEGWSLSTAEGRKALKKLLLDYCRARGIKRIGLLVIDTLAEATPGLDENSPEQGHVLTWSKQLACAIHGHVMVLHHKAKHSEGARGHTSAPGAADTIWELSESSGIVTAKLTKQRDLATKSHGAKFTIKSHPTGQVTNFGDIVTVARVEYIDDFGEVDDESKPLSQKTELEHRLMNFLLRQPEQTWEGSQAQLMDLIWPKPVDGEDEGPVPRPDGHSSLSKVKNDLVKGNQLKVEKAKKHWKWTWIEVDLDAISKNRRSVPFLM